MKQVNGKWFPSAYSYILVYNEDMNRWARFDRPGDAYSAICGYGIYTGKKYSQYYVRVSIKQA
jgi:hypothetical protein